MTTPNVGDHNRLAMIITRATGSPDHFHEDEQGRISRTDHHTAADAKQIMYEIFALRQAALFSGWKRPDKIRMEIDDLIERLESTIAAIQKLDSYAMWKSRRFTPEEIARDIDEVVDKRAMREMRLLQKALGGGREVVEESMAARPYTDGRPPNWRARYLALQAAVIFHHRTGIKPTWWNPEQGCKSTPFGEMVKQLFKEFGIDADIQSPIEWAIGKLPQFS